ncbi:MAG TPA: peptidoglycan-binding domain-containing protein [Thermoanaerobaculia bacterium]|nr:peptidoglycan-binding domain-containing protein [Thermoanaerobaculia bacterium]
MAPLYDIFLRTGVWFAILAALAWIAYAKLSSTQDQAERWVKAFSEPWLLKVAVGLALLPWAWSFMRLFWGGVYLRGAGAFAELSTVLLIMILAFAGVAWWCNRPATPFHPWVTHGLVLLLILSPGQLLLEAPAVLSQDTGERDAVGFVQGRLDHLRCFDAVFEPVPTDESFDALTTAAVISFQLANGLLKDPKTDKPGEIHRREFRLLARPFPFLFSPKPCSRRAP